jgi:hypothetical protein
LGKIKVLMKNIFKAYQYLFYKYSCWDTYSWNKKNTAAARHTGLCILSSLFWANFLTISMMVQLFTGYIIIDFTNLSKLKMIGFGSIFLIVNYYNLSYKEKYIKIFNKFKNENKTSHIKGSIFAWSYCILTFVFLGIVAFLCGHFQIEGRTQNFKDLSSQSSHELGNKKEANFAFQNIKENDKLRLPIVKN